MRLAIVSNGRHSVGKRNAVNAQPMVKRWVEMVISRRSHGSEALDDVSYQGPFVNPADRHERPFCAALGWLTGTVSCADVRNVAHAATGAMARRIDVIADPSRALYRPRLQVSLSDGRVLEWHDDASEHSYTLTWPAAIRAAPLLLAETGICGDAADGLIAACAQAENQSTVAPIIAAVRSAISVSRYAPAFSRGTNGSCIEAAETVA
jgi:hypothetical protein